MLVIGINGRPGAGKTTVSELLFNDKNKSIIHLDNLFDRFKIKYFSNSVKVLKKSDGACEPYIDSCSKVGKVIRIKGLKLALYQVKKMYANFYLNSVIKSTSPRVDYLIIEGRALDVYNLECFCDVKLFIDASSNKRYIRMIDRTVSGLTSADVRGVFTYDLKKDINLSGYHILKNDSNLEHLADQVKVFEKVVQKSNRVHKKG